jgi:DNA repair photolyase
MKPTIVNIPSIKTPIMRSPGFEKKELATYKLDIMGWCGASCLYCSTPAMSYLRINRERFADAAEAQTGERLYPGKDQALTLRWEDFEARLDAQLAKWPKNRKAMWGAGKVLMFSQLTDAFSPWAVAEGLTRRTLEKVLLNTDFRIRVLTKFDTVGRPEWIEFFRAHPGRFVVGLSIGTLDDAWARKVEIGTSSPSARVRALHRLQDAGVPTFGMLCPVFPDVLADNGVERLVEAIWPDRCETVWSEPFNDRNNWRIVADGYEKGSRAHERMSAIFGGPNRVALWSEYAAELYERVHGALGGEAHKHRYLLYQDGMTPATKAALTGAPGVLFQSDETTGKKSLPVIGST